MSGVGGTSHPSPAIVSTEGPGVTTQITVSRQRRQQRGDHDTAGQHRRSAPIVNVFVDGTPGANGWYTSDVQVNWQVVKTPQNILAQAGCVNGTVTADTMGTTFSCSVTSGAGTTSRSVTIKRDATPPVLAFGTRSPAPNTNGWNKTNVSIPFTRSDAMSGLASTSATSPLVFSTEGAGLTRDVVVTDLAGNAATFTTAPRNIDKTVPYAEIPVPDDTATLGFYADVAAQYECVDLSLEELHRTECDRELINTKTTGARTYKITAKDLAGFTTTHTHSFTVASQFNFDGFLAPAREPATLNLVSRGSLVPIRWRLPDGHGGFVSSTVSFVSATVATFTCGSATAVPLNDTASGAAGISFEASTGTFTYNWQTTASWTGCRKLTIKLKDNSTHELRFKFQQLRPLSPKA